MVERCLRTAEVRGSTPLTSTKSWPSQANTAGWRHVRDSHRRPPVTADAICASDGSTSGCDKLRQHCLDPAIDFVPGHGKTLVGLIAEANRSQPTHSFPGRVIALLPPLELRNPRRGAEASEDLAKAREIFASLVVCR